MAFVGFGFDSRQVHGEKCILMHDKLENFLAAFRLSQRARKIIRWNLLLDLTPVLVEKGVHALQDRRWLMWAPC